jgi:capsular polysaccharide biosynthesis protein
MLLPELNLTGVYNVLLANLKKMILLVVIATGIGTAIAFLIPRQYQATATLLAGNSLMSDRSVIFSENRMSPVSNIGSAEDMDRITSLATLDTVFKMIVDTFDLVKHYKITIKGDSARFKAMLKLKEDRSAIERTQEKQIKITMWDTDKKLAVAMANMMVAIVQQMNQAIVNRSNISILQRLRNTYKEKEEKLNAAAENADERNRLTEELNNLHKLISEYEVAISDKTEMMIVVEKASLVYNGVRPKRLPIIFTSFVASIAFAVVLVLFVNRKKLWNF